MRIQRLKLVYCFLSPDEDGELVRYVDIEQLQAELIELKRPMESAGFKADGMIAVGQELIRRDKQIKQLKAELDTAKKKIETYKEALASKFNAAMCDALSPLKAKIDTAKAANKRLRDALQKLRDAEVSNMKPKSIALYLLFIKETAEQALNPKAKESN